MRITLIFIQKQNNFSELKLHNRVRFRCYAFPNSATIIFPTVSEPTFAITVPQTRQLRFRSWAFGRYKFPLLNRA